MISARQAFLEEMLESLDALPKHELITNRLVDTFGNVCAIGAVGRKRGIAMEGMPNSSIPNVFGIPKNFANTITDVNDRFSGWNPDGNSKETPAQRFARVRNWVQYQLNDSRKKLAQDS